MSHSKMTKKGRSHYLESWNPRAKKFIRACAGCGRRGFDPRVLKEDFPKDAEYSVIRQQLEEVLQPLELDAAGLCVVCAEHT